MTDLLGLLPTVNAALNGTAAILLSCGYVMIRARRIALHRACMLAAFAASLLFLASYTVYHAQVGSHAFPGRGAARLAYLSILLSHVVLAALILPLAIVTLARALSARYAKHVKVARWTLPLWIYVSVTGVVIYVMLYRITW
jgi:putative membrane protein